jgi:hypothetical protein
MIAEIIDNIRPDSRKKSNETDELGRSHRIADAAVDLPRIVDLAVATIAA